MVIALPYNSLPLSFRLLPALSTAVNTVSVVSVNLPLSNSPQTNFDSTAAPSIEIIRILDPEHGEPFISIARVWACCDLTPVQGLLQFNLRKPAYDSILAGVAPFQDIWIPLRLARTIAEELGRLDELAGLLEWETRTAWSAEDKEGGGGMVHNWKVSSDRIAPDEYSFEKLISTTFPRINLLPSGIQIRTLTAISPPTLLSSAVNLLPSNFEQLFSKIVEWSIFEHERHLDLVDEQSDADEYKPTQSSSAKSNGLNSREQDLIFANTFTTLLSLLNLDGSIPSSALLPPAGSSCRITDDFVVERKDVLKLGDAVGMGKGRLGLVHAIGMLALGAWSRELERVAKTKVDSFVESRRLEKVGALEAVQAEQDRQKELESITMRLAALEAENTSKGVANLARVDHSDDIHLINRHLSSLRFKLDTFEGALAAKSTSTIPYPTSSFGSSTRGMVVTGLLGWGVGELVRRVDWKTLVSLCVR